MSTQQGGGALMPMETSEYDDDGSVPRKQILGCLPPRTTNKDFLPAWRIRMRLFFFAILQNSLMGGVIFGWASVDQSVLSASMENGGAGLSLHNSALIFSCASSISMFAPFLLGAVLDCYGPRVCSFVSCCIMAFGAILFASASHFAQFAIASCLLSFGGPGINSSIIHISNLFPGNANLAMATLSGSVAMSFSVFAVFDILWSRWELTVHSLFTAYAIIIMMLALGALYLYPDEPFEESETDNASDEDSSKAAALPAIHETEDLLVSLDGAATLKTDHQDHCSNHVQSVISNASLHIDQPLDSYLRDERKLYHKSESFAASKKVLMTPHNEELAGAISLKDMPFKSQLCSAFFLRATVVFVVTSFATNFYVASISTEMADLHYYDSDVQHHLSQSFTVIMAMGAFISVFIGWLIDQIGVEACVGMTLCLGQIQMLILLFFRSNVGWFKASFWVYTLFRQFLYPVYIASITSRLGFKYFGVLLGLGFGASGIAQLFVSLLDDAVQGDCHLPDATVEEQADCDEGFWLQLHLIQMVLLVVLLIAPYQDYREKTIREEKIKQVLYGTFGENV
eukprot:scaffold1868_cov193-Cylindrotheca_fusiformis.AAC.11